MTRARLGVASLGVLVLATAAPLRAQASGGISAHESGMDMDRIRRIFLVTDVLEYVPSGLDRPVTLDATGWIGGDYNRVFVNLEGEQSTRGRVGSFAADVSLGRLISPFWTVTAGARVETIRAENSPRRTRGLLALGFEGIAPGFFTLEPALYVSPAGQVSGQVTSTIDLLVTQRLILQPRLELNAAVQRVRAYQVGSGLNDVEFGGRLRYEIRREFAPYVGVVWFRRVGETASLARAAGESLGQLSLVAGLRLWR